MIANACDIQGAKKKRRAYLLQLTNVCLFTRTVVTPTYLHCPLHSKHSVHFKWLFVSRL